MSSAVSGVGEGAGGGRRLSLLGGAGESAEVTSRGGPDFVSTSLLTGLGDSNVELGGGSMMGVVQINKEEGTV